MGKLIIYSKFEHMFWLKIAQKLSEISIGNGLIQILWLGNHDSLELAIKAEMKNFPPSSFKVNG